MSRVIIGIPSGEAVPMDFTIALSHLIVHSLARGITVDVINSRDSLLPRSRHRIVKGALATGAEHLLLIDSDMVFPKDTLETLLTTGKDIVGCNYLTRQPPFKPTCRDEHFVPIRGGRHSTISEVAYIATGCLLVALKVFKDIGRPYFDTRYMAGLDDWEGEDYQFCSRAREGGYRIYCHHELSERLGHIGQRTYRLSTLNKPAFPSNAETFGNVDGPPTALSSSHIGPAI